ncbi:acyltransferase family protein [Hyphomonas sp.]|uniref:acyltransferase family protein n=1 Tax=Hyphomonas sp. TaxID=87 RepID=UPI003526D12C
MSAGRIDWIDHAKGLGIILVVMSCAALAYGTTGDTANWMLGLADWALPFVIPAFFLLSGLFLHRSLYGSASVYFDRKILRLVYFFALWLAIETVILNAGAFTRGPAEIARLYLAGWIAPESPLWFLQQLALFHIATRAIRRLKPVRVLAAGALLQMLAAAGLFHTGWSVADHFAANFVFFYAGYVGASLAFSFAKGAAARWKDLARALAIWACVHTAFVVMGISGLPIVSLILGFAGSFALIGLGVMLSSLPAAHLIGDTGRQSLAVYLGFFIPLQALVTLVQASGIFADAGAASLATAAAALMVALGIHRFAMGTPLRALYVRPQIFRLKPSMAKQRGSLLVSPPRPEA